MQQVRSNTWLSFGSAQPSKVAQFSVGDNSPGSITQSVCAEGQIRRAEHSQRPQEIHRGAGAQDAADCVCRAQEQDTLPRQGGGLRGLERATKRTALDEDVDQARLHAHCRSRSRLIAQQRWRCFALRHGQRRAGLAHACRAVSFTLTGPKARRCCRCRARCAAGSSCPVCRKSACP